MNASPAWDRSERPRGRRAATLLPLALAACAISSCTFQQVFVGSPFPEETYGRLAAGMTQSEVMALLGPPDEIGLRLDGSAFTWRHQSESDTGLSVSVFQASLSYDYADRRTEKLVVLFDKRGRVTVFGKD